MEGEGERESWRMKRDGDMHMRGGRIKERSRGRQQKGGRGRRGDLRLKESDIAGKGGGSLYENEIFHCV